MKLYIHIDANTGFQFNCDAVIPDGDLFDPASHQRFVVASLRVVRTKGRYTVGDDCHIPPEQGSRRLHQHLPVKYQIPDGSWCGVPEAYHFCIHQKQTGFYRLICGRIARFSSERLVCRLAKLSIQCFFSDSDRRARLMDCFQRTIQGSKVYFTNSRDCCSILEKLDFSRSPTI